MELSVFNVVVVSCGGEKIVPQVYGISPIDTLSGAFNDMINLNKFSKGMAETLATPARKWFGLNEGVSLRKSNTHIPPWDRV